MRNVPPNRQPKVVNGRNNQQRTFGKFARNMPKTQTYTENRQLERATKTVTDQPPKS